MPHLDSPFHTLLEHPDYCLYARGLPAERYHYRARPIDLIWMENVGTRSMTLCSLTWHWRAPDGPQELRDDLYVALVPRQTTTILDVHGQTRYSSWAVQACRRHFGQRIFVHTVELELKTAQGTREIWFDVRWGYAVGQDQCAFFVSDVHH